MEGGRSDRGRDRQAGPRRPARGRLSRTRRLTSADVQRRTLRPSGPSATRIDRRQSPDDWPADLNHDDCQPGCGGLFGIDIMPWGGAILP